MINDETKYKTEIFQIAIKKDEYPNEDSFSLTNNQNEYKFIPSISAINVEEMRQSYYDTITNVTIDDITMKMQGQTVECFAYSFVNDEPYHGFSNNKKSSPNFVGNLNKISNLVQNNIMSTKSVVQVDCNFEFLSNFFQ